MPLPKVGDDWQTWFVSNTKSFRRALLRRRDGARLHAGTQPMGSARERSEAKMSFLVQHLTETLLALSAPSPHPHLLLSPNSRSSTGRLSHPAQ
ncbi:TetR/AcrR family transcriptional regulator C-terminal domain-containing protein [Curtobacterium sp. 9128]|uniref:TetR/AcrR family transcriptional regulator C-terminal domain-containing protein n=1 Tax=Curtobacterium sp. 9128 TaxID=1793722 RepID=UPI001C92C547